jgi:hypothetical protein
VAFPADLEGVCRKRQFSLLLEPAYSGLLGWPVTPHSGQSNNNGFDRNNK